MVAGLWLVIEPALAQEQSLQTDTVPDRVDDGGDNPPFTQEQSLQTDVTPESLDTQVPSLQAPATPEYVLTIGVREWITQGRSAHNIGAAFGPPNVTSELKWRGLNVPITQLNADLLVRDRFVAEAIVGYGSRGHGTLRDEDYTGDNRTQKFSDTLSQIDGGSVLTVSLTTGVRVVNWNATDNPIPGGIDLLVGYQYWSEQYEATGVQDLLAGGSRFTGVPAITQTNTWNSIRFGTRASVPLLSRFALKGSVYYIPFTAYRNEDVHHLRTDLRKDPSFLTEATGGSGVQLEGSVVVRVWQRLTVEAGYAYWDIRSGSGTVQAFNSNGTIGIAEHNEEHTRRQGVFFGVNWIF